MDLIAEQPIKGQHLSKFVTIKFGCYARKQHAVFYVPIPGAKQINETMFFADFEIYHDVRVKCVHVFDELGGQKVNGEYSVVDNPIEYKTGMLALGRRKTCPVKDVSAYAAWRT